MDSAPCQEQLIKTCKHVIGEAEKVLVIAQMIHSSYDVVKDYEDAVSAITEDLNSLVDQVKVRRCSIYTAKQ